MTKTKLCERCNRRIKSEAVSCLCGWSASGAQPVKDAPSVTYAQRKAASEASMYADRRSMSPLVEEIRKAFQTSRAKLSGLRPMAGLLPREPGSDDEELAA